MISLRYISSPKNICITKERNIGENYEPRNSNTFIGNIGRNNSSSSCFYIRFILRAKIKNKTILEISKNIDDPSKLEDLIGLLDERKKHHWTIEEVGL